MGNRYKPSGEQSGRKEFEEGPRPGKEPNPREFQGEERSVKEMGRLFQEGMKRFINEAGKANQIDDFFFSEQLGKMSRDVGEGMDSVSQEEVQSFIDQGLPEHADRDYYSDTGAGLFLTALIHKIPRDNVRLDLRDPDVPRMNRIGYRLPWDKRLAIDGETGQNTGDNVKGVIFLNGPTGKELGSRLDGGTITANNTAGEEVAYKARRGKIQVKEGRVEVSSFAGEDVTVTAGPGTEGTQVWPNK